MKPSVVKLMVVRALFVAFLTFVVVLLFLKPSMVELFVVAVFAVGLVPLVVWHTRISAFVCPHCSAKFHIAAFISFLSPHVPGKKWLYCPECHEASWCQRVPR